MAGNRKTKQELKKPDAFQRYFSRFVPALRQRRQELVLFSVALLVLVGATLIWSEVKKSKNNKSQAALYAIDDSYNDLIEKLKSGDDVEAAVVEDQVAKLSELVNQHSKTTAEQEAMIRLAELAYYQAKYEDAIRHYNEVLKSMPSQSEYRAIILTSIAYSHEGLNDYKTAAETFMRSAGIPEHPLRDDSFFHAARNYELSGDRSKAKETYEAVLKEFPETDLKGLIAARIKELSS